MSIICKLPEIHETIERTKSPDWHVRLQALKEICPCRVLKDIDLLWDRVLEMAKSNEPNDTVRYQILHTLCDGSPRSREAEIIEAIQLFWNDPSDKIRRRARKALESYRRTALCEDRQNYVFDNG